VKSKLIVQGKFCQAMLQKLPKWAESIKNIKALFWTFIHSVRLVSLSWKDGPRALDNTNKPNYESKYKHPNISQFTMNYWRLAHHIDQGVGLSTGTNVHIFTLQLTGILYL
jgi:hypothetical protein